ncbi:ATP-binding cassette domain-containing protein [Micromonospora sp. CA-246542]|uniref:ATP-binding cassette domain-containing protein n=1 Tax=Micromonospora sp. CA-246542 TaxID=3239959 RepID=UPI003D9468B4
MKLSGSAPRCETVGLRGPSGSGKSTLVRVLALLHRPDHGQVSIDGTPVTAVRYAVPIALRTRVAALFQSPRDNRRRERVGRRFTIPGLVTVAPMRLRSTAAIADLVDDSALSAGFTAVGPQGPKPSKKI